MTVAAAQKFILKAVQDRELVSRINLAMDSSAVQQILSELEMEFNYEELEQAYFNVLTWCRTHDQANAVKEAKLWWDILSYSLAHECDTNPKMAIIKDKSNKQSGKGKEDGAN